MNPTEQIYQSMLTAYDHFNTDLFDGKLPPVLIVLQRKTKTMGYFSPNRWQDASGRHTDEVAVNPEYFLGYPLMEVFQTLCHEQCHLHLHHFGKPGRKGYHNKEFADLMESIGLPSSSTGRPGGRRTGQKMSDYVVIDGPFYKAACALLESGFALPWIDRRPVPTRAAAHTVYTDQEQVAQVTPTDATLPLFIPLGACIQTPSAEESQYDTDPDVDADNEPLQQPEPAMGESAPVSGFDTVRDLATTSMASVSHIKFISPVIPVTGAARKPTRTKYSCPGCKTNLWGRPKLSITCNDCNKVFEYHA